jgi:hypothetical protein
MRMMRHRHERAPRPQRRWIGISVSLIWAVLAALLVLLLWAASLWS